MPTQETMQTFISAFFQNCPKLEVIQIPFYGEWINYVTPIKGILLSNRRSNLLVNSNHFDESQMHYAKCEKRDSKGYILYNLIYMTFRKRQNYRDRKQIGGCRGWG